jgi:hypothetical protein
MSSSITVKELLDDRFYRESRRVSGILRVYEICAEDFLRFAKQDSEGKDLRSRANALGNIKRAIECRIDSLLYNYCLHVKSGKENWDFPRKIEVIQQLGIVAPKILRKINKKRNELEHRYVKPTQADVDDGLDVAELFLASTSEIANQPILNWGVREVFSIEIDRGKGLIRLIDHAKKAEGIATIGKEDEWIEFAKKLSALHESYYKKFHKQDRISL